MIWLMENLATIVIGLIVLGGVSLVIRGIYRNRKAGKYCSCGSSCRGCTGCSSDIEK